MWSVSMRGDCHNVRHLDRKRCQSYVPVSKKFSNPPAWSKCKWLRTTALTSWIVPAPVAAIAAGRLWICFSHFLGVHSTTWGSQFLMQSSVLQRRTKSSLHQGAEAVLLSWLSRVAGDRTQVARASVHLYLPPILWPQDRGIQDSAAGVR